MVERRARKEECGQQTWTVKFMGAKGQEQTLQSQNRFKSQLCNFTGCVILGLLLNFSELQFSIYKIDKIMAPAYRVIVRIR